MKANVTDMMVVICLQDMFAKCLSCEDQISMVVICVCVFSCLQTESDLGCPGGKARIIHKESDIITAFAINKVKAFYRDITNKLKTL